MNVEVVHAHDGDERPTSLPMLQAAASPKDTPLTPSPKRDVPTAPMLIELFLGRLAGIRSFAEDFGLNVLLVFNPDLLLIAVHQLNVGY